jgi:hypothetical protein
MSVCELILVTFEVKTLIDSVILSQRLKYELLIDSVATCELFQCFVYYSG